MNFQNLQNIETADRLLDQAFRAGKTVAERLRMKSYRDRITKSRAIERERVLAVGRLLASRFDSILHAFPLIDDLPPFYRELVKITVDYNELKKSLGTVLWAKDKVEHFTKIYKGKVGGSKQIEDMNVHRRAFYGRMASICKQANAALLRIESARKTMKGFPTIKTSLPTVCIYGFPNVGKTTLLYKLTGSKPEISNYAFTTRNINVAYFSLDGDSRKTVQVVDTPGTLNRPERMNNVEKQARLVLELVAQKIVYVFDPTESFPLAEQEALYKKLRSETTNKRLLVYVAKKDVAAADKLSALVKRYDAITDVEELKKQLV